MSAPNLVPITSSNIAAIGHDPATNTLHVQFKDGPTWKYDGVTPEQHAALIGADSIGSHFHKNIKGAFNSSKVE